MTSTNSVSTNVTHGARHNLDNIHNHVSGRPRLTSSQQRLRALERLRSLYPPEDTIELEERHRGSPSLSKIQPQCKLTLELETLEIMEQTQNLRLRNAYGMSDADQTT